MTPVEKELRKHALRIFKRANVIAQKLPDPESADTAVQALIMALLERLDARALRDAEETVAVRKIVDDNPGEESRSLERLRRLLTKADLDRGCSYARRRDQDFVYGEHIMFGYTVSRNGKNVLVTVVNVHGGMNDDDQRTYVNGDSYFWEFAPNELRSRLGLRERP